MKTILIFIFIFAYHCKLVRRIVGGFPVSANSWTVLLHHERKRCGGVLYTANCVITAAHCTTYVPRQWIAYLNRGNLKVDFWLEGATHHRVLEWVKHNQFNPKNMNYDIAVWRIEKAMFKIVPVKLANHEDYYFRPKEPVSIMGWGAFNKVTLDEIEKKSLLVIGSDILRKADIYLVHDNICRNTYHKHVVSQIMFCTGGSGNRGVCQGDSGGPVYRIERNFVSLLGIISFTNGCGQKNWFDVSARMSHSTIKSFIYSAVEIYSSRGD